MGNDRKFPIMELEGEGAVELTTEQRYRTLATIFRHQFFELHRQIADRFGWDVANELAGTVTDPSVPHVVEGYRRKFGLDGEGAALLSQVLQAEFQAEGSDVHVCSETADHAEIEVSCFFGDGLQDSRYSELPIADGLCNAGCLQWMRNIGETVDGAVDAERVEWMAEGASRCRFLLDRRDSAGG